MAEKEIGPEPAGIGVLDILLAAIQAWKAILVAGVLFGLAGWGLASVLLTPSYEIVAEVSLLEEELIPVLDGAPAEGVQQQSQRAAADAPAPTAVGSDSDGSFFTRPSDRCFTIDEVVTCNRLLGVHAPTPARAETLLWDALAQLQKRYPDGGAASLAAQREVDGYARNLTGLRRAVSQLQTALTTDAATAADYASGIIALQQNIENIERISYTAKQRLLAFQDVLYNKPGPAVLIGPQPGLIGAVAAIVAMLLVLNLALIRIHVLRQDPNSDTRIRLRQIRAALNLSGHK